MAMEDIHRRLSNAPQNKQAFETSVLPLPPTPFCRVLTEPEKPAVDFKEAAPHSDISFTSMRYVHMARHRLQSEVDEALVDQ